MFPGLVNELHAPNRIYGEIFKNSASEWLVDGVREKDRGSKNLGECVNTNINDQEFK